MDNSKSVLPYKVRMSLCDIEIHDTSVDDFESDGYVTPTFKDLAALLYSAFPSGVGWQLGWELSKKMDVDYNSVLIALDNIVEEYLKMNEKEAVKKYDENPHPGRSFFNHLKATFKRKENL